MAKLTSRWYRDDRDLERMLRLVSASANADGPEFGHFHRGDVVWGLFPNLTKDPTTFVRLFEDGRGALRGFVWLYPPDEFATVVNTAATGAADFLREMIAWAGGHLGGDRAVETQVPSSDTPQQEALLSLGYRRTDRAPYQLNAQPLVDEIPAPVLPPGAVVRPVRHDDSAEVEARVALHREVWEPSKFSAEGYARLRTKPVYRPDLDLVAVTPSGDLAAYAIVWWDPETTTGLFEPVGAAVAHRRQGYARAVMYEGLRRLRAMDASHAAVVSATDVKSEPARRLYAATGFEVVARFEVWEREPIQP